MDVLYKSGSMYIVKVKDSLYYYGDGDKHNSFGFTPMIWLRFNPYMDYVKELNIDVPEKIVEYIKNNIPNEPKKFGTLK